MNKNITLIAFIFSFLFIGCSQNGNSILGPDSMDYEDGAQLEIQADNLSDESSIAASLKVDQSFNQVEIKNVHELLNDTDDLSFDITPIIFSGYSEND